MNTTTRLVDADGSLVSEPGDYDIVNTVVRLTSTRKSNGINVDGQDVIMEHTVVRRPDPGEPQALHRTPGAYGQR